MTPYELVREAINARNKAYAPYSNFQVGAALLSAGGRVYKGCNVENASYGATSCAERNAIFNAISAGARSFTAIAIVADDENYCSPCGICRQVMVEFAPDMPVYMGKLDGSYCEKKAKELLPDVFTLPDS